VLVSPIGLYLLIGKLLQSFGIFFPGFSESAYEQGRDQRVFTGIILIVWLREIPGIIASLRNSKPDLLVSSDGLEFPSVWKLEWDEIDHITGSYGFIKFHPKDKNLKPQSIFPLYASQKKWKAAKELIKRHAPERLTRSF